MIFSRCQRLNSAWCLNRQPYAIIWQSKPSRKTFGFIDLAIDRTIFNLDGELTKKKVKQLRKESSVFVRDELYKQLSDAIGHCLLIKYPIFPLSSRWKQDHGHCSNLRKVWKYTV